MAADQFTARLKTVIQTANLDFDFKYDIKVEGYLKLKCDKEIKLILILDEEMRKKPFRPMSVVSNSFQAHQDGLKRLSPKEINSMYTAESEHCSNATQQTGEHEGKAASSRKRTNKNSDTPNRSKLPKATQKSNELSRKEPDSERQLGGNTQCEKESDNICVELGNSKSSEKGSDSVDILNKTLIDPTLPASQPQSQQMKNSGIKTRSTSVTKKPIRKTVCLSEIPQPQSVKRPVKPLKNSCKQAEKPVSTLSVSSSLWNVSKPTTQEVTSVQKPTTSKTTTNITLADNKTTNCQDTQTDCDRVENTLDTQNRLEEHSEDTQTDLSENTQSTRLNIDQSTCDVYIDNATSTSDDQNPTRLQGSPLARFMKFKQEFVDHFVNEIVSTVDSNVQSSNFSNDTFDNNFEQLENVTSVSNHSITCVSEPSVTCISEPSLTCISGPNITREHYSRQCSDTNAGHTSTHKNVVVANAYGSSNQSLPCPNTPKVNPVEVINITDDQVPDHTPHNDVMVFNISYNHPTPPPAHIEHIPPETLDFYANRMREFEAQIDQRLQSRRNRDGDSSSRRRSVSPRRRSASPRRHSSYCEPRPSSRRVDRGRMSFEAVIEKNIPARHRRKRKRQHYC